MFGTKTSRLGSGAAHLAVGLIALAGVFAAPAVWPQLKRPAGLESLDRLTSVAALASLTYLVFTALLEVLACLGIKSAATSFINRPAVIAFGHALVLVAAGASLLRGPRSLALLTGLDSLLALLLTVSALALAVSLIECWRIRRQAASAGWPALLGGTRAVRGVNWAASLAAILSAGSLICIETRAVPNSASSRAPHGQENSEANVEGESAGTYVES